MKTKKLLFKGILVIGLCIFLVQIVVAYNNGVPSTCHREIYADAPWRLEPGVTEIPVLIFVN